MNKYDSYKPSGIEWIGEIPSHWGSSRYRYFYFSNMGVTLLKEYVKENGIYPVYSATETDMLFGYVDEAAVILNEGDIVIPARGNSIGHIKVVSSPSTSTQTTIYSKKISQNIETNFVKYFLQGLREHLFQFDRTAIPQITVNQVKNNPIVIPPPSEQSSIAAYLDRKTAEIDELIADKRRLLQLYEEEKTSIINQAVTKGTTSKDVARNVSTKMKDSGIEWLGEIPEHWEVKRFKYYFNLITEKVEEDLPKIGLENIESKSGKFIETDNDFSGQGVRFRPKDILFGKLRPYLAKVWLSNFDGQAVGDFYVFRSKQEVHPEFAKYRILDSSFIEVTNSSTYGSKMPRVSWEFIADLPIAFPKIQEQQSIVHHIETECALINSKKAKTKRLIELLSEYRTALISEVVTGKIKVTNL